VYFARRLRKAVKEDAAYFSRRRAKDDARSSERLVAVTLPNMQKKGIIGEMLVEDKGNNEAA
jgi:hypothetical protein